MGFSYWFRLAIMVVAFVAVVMAIRRLHQGQTSTALKIDLCTTRIHSMRLASGIKIYEKDMKWYRDEGGKTVELDPVEVERWFSRDCALPAQPVASAAKFEKALDITYVAGPPQILLQGPSGEFEWQGRRLKSPELEAALRALPELPLATVSGHGRVGD